MASEAQIERAASVALYYGELPESARPVVAAAMRDALAPTPEERERGIEAAREAVRNVAALNRALFGNENGCAETMADKAISAYLAAVGGSDA